jgi:hypothetical protein
MRYRASLTRFLFFFFLFGRIGQTVAPSPTSSVPPLLEVDKGRYRVDAPADYPYRDPDGPSSIIFMVRGTHVAVVTCLSLITHEPRRRHDRTWTKPGSSTRCALPP